MEEFMKNMDDSYQKKFKFMMGELQKRDKIIESLSIKEDKDSQKYSEINEKMVDIQMVERKLVKTTSTYVQEIRKILAHYCNCLSNVIFEWVGIKTAYTRVRKKEFTMKALDSQIN